MRIFQDIAAWINASGAGENRDQSDIRCDIGAFEIYSFLGSADIDSVVVNNKENLLDPHGDFPGQKNVQRSGMDVSHFSHCMLFPLIVKSPFGQRKRFKH